MKYLPNDKRWIDERAHEIAHLQGLPLPIARSEAMTEWELMQKQPSAEIVDISVRRHQIGDREQ